MNDFRFDSVDSSRRRVHPELLRRALLDGRARRLRDGDRRRGDGRAKRLMAIATSAEWRRAAMAIVG